MAAIEEALGLVSAVRAEDHSGHRDWVQNLARVNLLIRLYCGPNVQGAFSAIKDSLLLVAKYPDRANAEVMLMLGEATLYLETTARFDLDVSGTTREVEAAKTKFLSAAKNLVENQRS